MYWFIWIISFQSHIKILNYSTVDDVYLFTVQYSTVRTVQRSAVQYSSYFLFCGHLVLNVYGILGLKSNVNSSYSLNHRGGVFIWSLLSFACTWHVQYLGFCSWMWMLTFFWQLYQQCSVCRVQTFLWVSQSAHNNQFQNGNMLPVFINSRDDLINILHKFEKSLHMPHSVF
jgi:hypothetical protein